MDNLSKETIGGRTSILCEKFFDGKPFKMAKPSGSP